MRYLKKVVLFIVIFLIVPGIALADQEIGIGVPITTERSSPNPSFAPSINFYHNDELAAAWSASFASFLKIPKASCDRGDISPNPSGIKPEEIENIRVTFNGGRSWITAIHPTLERDWIVPFNNAQLPLGIFRPQMEVTGKIGTRRFTVLVSFTWRARETVVGDLQMMVGEPMAPDYASLPPRAAFTYYGTNETRNVLGPWCVSSDPDLAKRDEQLRGKEGFRWATTPTFQESPTPPENLRDHLSQVVWDFWLLILQADPFCLGQPKIYVLWLDRSGQPMTTQNGRRRIFSYSWDGGRTWTKDATNGAIRWWVPRPGYTSFDNIPEGAVLTVKMEGDPNLLHSKPASSTQPRIICIFEGGR